MTLSILSQLLPPPRSSPQPARAASRLSILSQLLPLSYAELLEKGRAELSILSQLLPLERQSEKRGGGKGSTFNSFPVASGENGEAAGRNARAFQFFPSCF